MGQVQYESDFSEFADAFRSTRAAKNIISWIIALAILVQLASFVLVDFVGVMDASDGRDPAERAVADSRQTAVTTQPGERVVLAEDADDVINFAAHEGLTAHAEAIRIRGKKQE